MLNIPIGVAIAVAGVIILVAAILESEGRRLTRAFKERIGGRW